MKKSRVSIIKDNINLGDKIPNACNDAVIGQWIDNSLAAKGHIVDKSGVMDLPEFNIDNKSRKNSSKAHHTVGSMVVDAYLKTAEFEKTRLHKKLQNQNQITYDTNFNEVTKIRIVDMDIDITQQALKEIYNNLRQKLIEGNRSKSIYSDCKRGLLDGYGHNNSYRFRLTDKFMKKIQNIAGSRDTFMKHFEEKK
jgi:hypothetical protein